MSRRLTAASTLDTLRKEAKRWLKALRSDDETARARLRLAYPPAPADPGLRNVQHALAREHGLESWAALKTRLADDRRNRGDDARAGRQRAARRRAARRFSLV